MHKVYIPKKEGRVHWLLWNMSPKILSRYILSYDYLYHRYIFYRMEGRSFRLYDVFIVFRSSKRCFRVMYSNCKLKVFEYISCKTSQSAADKMLEIMEKYQDGI